MVPGDDIVAIGVELQFSFFIADSETSSDLLDWWHNRYVSQTRITEIDHVNSISKTGAGHPILIMFLGQAEERPEEAQTMDDQLVHL